MSVVVAGDNIISALGGTTQENLAAVMAGKSGLKKYGGFYPAQSEDIIVSQIAEAQDNDSIVSKLSRLEKYMVASVFRAVPDPTVVSHPNTIFILSTTKGNIGLLNEDDPSHDGNPQLDLWHSAKMVAKFFNNPNVPIVISNACISGVVASVVAKRVIEQGLYDRAVVIGADEVTRFVISGFSSFKALSSSLCKPFDAKRNGLNLGEAVGTIIYERASAAGGKKIVLEGGSITNDANHISGPSRTGEGLYRAINECIASANKNGAANGKADELAFLNAHGTATLYNDQMESVAVSRAGLGGIPMFSLKGYFGHTLGASGVIESILCAHFLEDGEMPASLGFTEPGTEPPANIVTENKKICGSSWLKFASGFGGCNAAIKLTYRTLNVNDMSAPADTNYGLSIAKHAHIRLKGAEECVSPGNENIVKDGLDALYRKSGMDYPKFFKMDLMSKAGILLMDKLVGTPEKDEKSVGIKTKEKTALIFMNRSASLDTDVNFQETIKKEDFFPSPSVFVYTLPNIVMGEICIRYKYFGEGTFFIKEKFSTARVVSYIARLFKEGVTQRVILIWDECVKNYADVFGVVVVPDDGGGMPKFTSQNLTDLYII
jgi:3-oxoacyl-[acyl-carrier-protein] synthase-1